MSAPKPLYSLVEQWRKLTHGAEFISSDDLAAELQAALLAWDEHVATLKADTAIWHGGPFVRQQILGLPAKEARPSRSKDPAEKP